MATLTSAVLKQNYRKQVNNNGQAGETIAFIDVRSLFDTENEAVIYLRENFIPSWDSESGGTLPEYFLVKTTVPTEKIYHIAADGTATVYATITG